MNFIKCNRCVRIICNLCLSHTDIGYSQGERGQFLILAFACLESCLAGEGTTKSSKYTKGETTDFTDGEIAAKDRKKRKEEDNHRVRREHRGERNHKKHKGARGAPIRNEELGIGREGWRPVERGERHIVILIENGPRMGTDREIAAKDRIMRKRR